MSDTLEPKLDDTAPDRPKSPPRNRNSARDTKRVQDAADPTRPASRPRTTVDPTKPPTNRKQGRAMQAKHEHVAQQAFGVEIETETHYRRTFPVGEHATIARYKRKGYKIVPPETHALGEDPTIVVLEIEKEKYQERYLNSTRTISSYTNEDHVDEDDVDPDEELTRRRHERKKPETVEDLMDRMPDDESDEEDEDEEYG